MDSMTAYLSIAKNFQQELLKTQQAEPAIPSASVSRNVVFHACNTKELEHMECFLAAFPSELTNQIASVGYDSECQLVVTYRNFGQYCVPADPKRFSIMYDKTWRLQYDSFVISIPEYIGNFPPALLFV